MTKERMTTEKVISVLETTRLMFEMSLSDSEYDKDSTEAREDNEETIEAINEAIKALKRGNVLDKIKAEIERLHYHPKLDFIKNDDVVDMTLDIIDKYKEEQVINKHIKGVKS